METPRGEYVLALNGWVMNADPLVNFAGSESQVHMCVCCMCVKQCDACIYSSIDCWLWVYMYLCV